MKHLDDIDGSGMNLAAALLPVDAALGYTRSARNKQQYCSLRTNTCSLGMNAAGPCRPA
jgi:hypothetical protein